jgi:hypothetical protein
MAMEVANRARPWAAVTALILLAAIAGVVSASTAPKSVTSTPKAHRVRSGTPSEAGKSPSTPSTSTSPPSAPPELIEKVAFLNAEDGYGLFDENGSSSCKWAVASTDNGGVTFSSRVTVAPRPCYNSESIASFAFDDHGDGFVLGSSLYVSHDDGMTWVAAHTDGVVLSIVPLGLSVWMLESMCPSTSNGTTCGLVLQRSIDGGRSWSRPVSLPVKTAVGNGPTGPAQAWTWLLRTSVTSALILVPPLFTVPANQAPGRGTLLRTFDEDAQWQQQMAPCSIQLPSTALLSQAPDGTIWSACASQPGAGNQLKAFARSTNGGRTWISEAHCDPSSLGANCTPGDPFGGYLSDVAGLSSTTALIDGERNTVWLSADGGINWSEPSSPIGFDPNGSGGLFFADALDGWVVSESYGPAGSLWRTTNAGNSWSEVWQ